MNNIEFYLRGKKRIAIAGHVSPDGDCVGSVMGLKLYLRDNFPEIEADPFLASVQPIYSFIEDIDKVRLHCSKGEGKKYDMLICLDISSFDRIGVVQSMFDEVPQVLCIDHHKTNNGTYTYFCNDPAASSASEVLYRHLDPEKISKACAEALFMGIVHDTGVFRYSCTSPETMRIAADLMEKGIDSSRIIDETYYKKTIGQQQLQGYVLSSSKSFLDGSFIVGVIMKKDRDRYGVRPGETDGIVSLLRDTKGVEVSMLIHELDTGEMKLSLRSTAIVDVSSICQQLGGGGHVRAAGCKCSKTPEEILEIILPLVREQLEAYDS